VSDRSPFPPPADDPLQPIAGVSLEAYAKVVRGTAAYNYDSSMLPTLAAQHGIGDDAWHAAHQGWNTRIRHDPTVAQQFTDVYHAL
jgi:hypothetical protein